MRRSADSRVAPRRRIQASAEGPASSQMTRMLVAAEAASGGAQLGEQRACHPAAPPRWVDHPARPRPRHPR